MSQSNPHHATSTLSPTLILDLFESAPLDATVTELPDFRVARPVNARE